MQIVMVETPFNTPAHTRDDCVRYAQFCAQDSLNRGECPFASHLFYTHFLPEDKASRELGLRCRDRIATATEALIARYLDIGTSPGMFRTCDIDRRATIEARALAPDLLARWRRGERLRGSLFLIAYELIGNR